MNDHRNFQSRILAIQNAGLFFAVQWTKIKIKVMKFVKPQNAKADKQVVDVLAIGL